MAKTTHTPKPVRTWCRKGSTIEQIEEEACARPKFMNRLVTRKDKGNVEDA